MRKPTVKDVAGMLGVSPQCVRIGLQRGAFPFGTAYKARKNSPQYTHVIFPGKLREYVGEDIYTKWEEAHAD